MEGPSDTNLSPNSAVNHLADISHAAVINAHKQDERKVVFLIRNLNYKKLSWDIRQRTEEANGKFNLFRSQ